MLGSVRLRRRILAVLLAFGGASAAGGAYASSSTVVDVRAGIHGETTRLVLDMTDQVGFTVYTLADPYRVVIDLPEVGWNLPQRPLPSNMGHVQKVRYGLFRPGNSRVVIDTGGPVAVDKAFFIPPGADAKTHRFVLDLVKSSREAVLAGAKPEAGEPVATAVPEAAYKAVPETGAASQTAAAPRPSGGAAGTKAAMVFPAPLRKPNPRPSKRTIVIDPGHGGVDPGAVGVTGSYEKNLTLAVAQAFKGGLEATGRYKVVLTRDQDVFIRLRERVQIARDANADLFMSIHANTLSDARIRGLSVYTLSEKASDQEAAMLAERENKADLIAGVDLSRETSEVTNILIDLAQREAMNLSARFANILVKELSRETPLLPNAHRFAGFAVLKAPDVPSVLVEIGFLSNRQEEEALKQKRYRDKLAAAAVGAVDAYFSRVEEARKR